MHKSRLEALFAAQNRPDRHPSLSEKPMSQIFGEFTFGPKDVESLISDKKVIEDFRSALKGEAKLSKETASVIADKVKDWAIARGVTHFTHWFQPLTGLTAEKHDAFLSVNANGEAIEKFSAGQLIQSEPDASSFPSGGMRCTFEARGYTAWDISSPIFIVEHGGARILCVPSVFVSYTGHSLDTKTGLLRSMESINRSTVNLLHAMGQDDVKTVTCTVGVEQEYFLVDRAYYNLRPDLLLSGRTLVGAGMPKGQQLEDHYFGSIPSRVQAFMAEAEYELYRLGIPSKTRHNEVAPGQYEIAPTFEDANIAADHNMLTMEVLRRVAFRHGFKCLVHEKPFDGVNGSGKHNNWSIATDTGVNLLEPGQTPADNFRFLAVLSCVLKAVFTEQVALRATIASHGNDHRLGANEAPPAILSVFLGSTLSEILSTLEKGEDLSNVSAEQALIDFGLNQLPNLPKDNTDRNRTSPFAFTGNKFEFRAVGSSQAISFPMAILNAAVAQSMEEFRSRLEEKKKGAASLESAVLSVAKDFCLESQAIRFEGNGYSDEWKAEAKKRGLKELLTMPEAMEAFNSKEHHSFLLEEKVYTDEEFQSVLSVRLERYSKHLAVEAHALEGIISQHVLPATYRYQSELAKNIDDLKDVGVSCASQKDTLINIAEFSERLNTDMKQLAQKCGEAEAQEDDLIAQAKSFANDVLPLLNKIRESSDELEKQLPDEYWSLPKYTEMLYIR